MKNKLDTELQNFIKVSANTKTQTDTINLHRPVDINLYREKLEETIERDWEDREKERAIKAKNDALEDENKARVSLRWIILSIIVLWLMFVGIIILLQGFHVNIHYKHNHIYFDLPVSVINTLLGTTTLSIFGLYKVVVNYFFNKQ